MAFFQVQDQLLATFGDPSPEVRIIYALSHGAYCGLVPAMDSSYGYDWYLAGGLTSKWETIFRDFS